MSTAPAAAAIKKLSVKRHAEGGLLADDVLNTVSFDSLLDLLPATQKPAVHSIDSREPCTHAALAGFVSESVCFRRFGLGRNDVVAILMPNGPELAVAFVAVLTYCTCAPLNPANTPAEIREEMMSVGAKGILIADGEDNDPLMRIAEELDIVVMVATPNKTVCGLFELKDGLTNREPCDDTTLATKEKFAPQKRDDTAMVLHTSGSTGNKKVVPHLLEDLLAGALCIASACQLEESDICLNQMPLFHIGGIARNVLSPIISGGSVVAMPYFEPSLFWTVCVEKRCSWYYAGPTMHMLILDAYKTFPTPPKIHLRFVANAAGPLLPSVAAEMRDLYSKACGAFCSIMPSYGMTECMPISSPPVGYNLERPGTSGQIVGPRCQIQDGDGQQLPRGEQHVGQIMVQGHPVMRGYKNNPEETAANFLNGWFKTGDLGYMDDDNYIYITGRSKEVINRGGEIISPAEVEDALLSHPNIKSLVAFATPHDILQEAIGVCVVTMPGKPRVGLSGLHAHAAYTLHPSKWPNLVVYANDIPKTSTGKAMRVRLDKRMSLPSINDETPQTQRLFEAEMVAPGAPVQAPIPTKPIQLDLSQTSAALLALKDSSLSEAFACLRDHEGKQVIVAYVTPESADVGSLTAGLVATLDEYLVPSIIMPIPSMPYTAGRAIDEDALPQPIARQKHVAPATPTEETVQKIWMEVVGNDPSRPPSMDDDFFLSGGSSLLASTLAAKVKKQFGMPLSGTALFKLRTIPSISEAIDAHIRAQNIKESLVPHASISLGQVGNIRFSTRASFGSLSLKLWSTKEAAQTAPESHSKSSQSNLAVNPVKDQSRFFAVFVQSLPVIFNHPIRRIGSWAVFVVVWLWLSRPKSMGGLGVNRFFGLVLSILFVRLVCWIIFPLIGIAVKWLIIGRYRTGRYSLWGLYYLRWWLAHQVIRFCGRGFFDMSSGMLSKYYRLMGARIGTQCSIATECTLTEFDLITLGDFVALDSKTIISPFCVDGGEMMLSAIDIGSNCSAGPKTTIAPGAALPPGTCLPPLSSSHEIGDARPSHRKMCRAAFASPPQWLQLLVGMPILVAIQAIAQSPLIGLILLMVEGRDVDPNTWWDALNWFTQPRRLGFFFLIRFARTCVCPFIEFACVVLVKRLIIGRFEAGPCTSTRYKFQYWLTSKLCSADLCGVATLVGNHWGGVSFCMRLLGAKCGERVFWPGSGLDVVEYDLLTIGDDVVFGSRSTFFCSDGEIARPIQLLAGSNVADRCVVGPGVVLGVNACLGSGSFAAPDTVYMEGAVTVGSSGGDTVVLTQGGGSVGDPEKTQTRKPFGRTFYGTKNPRAIEAGSPANTATWCVPPIPIYVMYVWCWFAFAACFRAAQLPLSIFLVDLFFGGRDKLINTLVPNAIAEQDDLHNFGLFLLLLLASYIIVHLVFFVLALTIDISNKWLIIGRRQAGLYPWDTSNYCMRWNYYLSAAVIRKGLLDYLEGSAFIVWYFRALGCTIGRNVCLYPNGSDPMMTEPELVAIGDGACLNFCFIICHTNSKGSFALNNIVIGPRTTMRSFSRIMAGAVLEEDARMLEHTLALVGDVVEPATIWLGWPVRDMLGSDDYWKKRRHVVRLGRVEVREQKRVQAVHFAMGGDTQKKIVNLEAHIRQMTMENIKMKEETKQARLEQLTLAEKQLALTEKLQEKIDRLTEQLLRLEGRASFGRQRVLSIFSDGRPSVGGLLETGDSSSLLSADSAGNLAERRRTSQGLIPSHAQSHALSPVLERRNIEHDGDDNASASGRRSLLQSPVGQCRV